MLYKRNNPQLNKNGELIHLLSTEGLSKDILTHILDTAANFVSVSDREVKKVPLLRGKSVFNLFFENSTRTRTTFDIAATRLSAGGQTQLPFEVEGADIVVLDDVLYTGRTLRAVLNELFDYGRPARVRLAVLVDRGGRQLPVQADVAAARVALPESQSLALARDDAGAFRFQVENKA